MDVESMRLLAKAIALLAMMPTAIGEGLLVSSAFKAIGRNPKLEETLFSKVIISVALVETTAIYAFVGFFTL
jgi:F0F1-type ATP synthase membrane subunit c/vacuolar-type H+-ATPase subunit K